MGARQAREKVVEYIVENMYYDNNFSLVKVLSNCPAQSFYIFLAVAFTVGNFFILHFFRNYTFYCRLL